MGTDTGKWLCRLADADRRLALWCIAQCARIALPFARDISGHAANIVQLAEDIAMSRSSGSIKIENQISDAIFWLSRAGGSIGHGIGDASVRAAYAHRAIADMAYCCLCYDPRLKIYLQHAAVGIIWAVARQDFASHLTTEDARLLQLCKSQLWPLTEPTPEQVSAACAADQVAWDYILDMDIKGKIRADAILSAYERKDLGLIGWDPVGRAVRERVTISTNALDIASGIASISEGAA
jgi:hypothetical protein